jgi:hypothetical protein
LSGVQNQPDNTKPVGAWLAREGVLEAHEKFKGAFAGKPCSYKKL